VRLVKLPENLLQLSADLAADFDEITRVTRTIRMKLQEKADGKLLKGDEITGWLGEVYGKMLLNGRLVSDEYDYDIVAQDMRISIKARKGTSSGWNISSLIPKVEGENCPTHLMFIQFTDSYSLFRVWLFPWKELYGNRRFMEKKVRGEHRGYYVRIKPAKDRDYLIYWDDPYWRMERRGGNPG
jgi:hypothetical protein